MSKDRLYILGLKKRGEKHYGLTTWYDPEHKPMVYAVYQGNPGYWSDSVKKTPVRFIESEQEAEKDLDWDYIGFGWKSKPTETNLVDNTEADSE